MAAVSIFDIFKVGIGPSSSHTVGPMKAALAFVAALGEQAGKVNSIDISLHGSLAWTGKGHGTDSAVILGLLGLQPGTVDPDDVERILREAHDSKRLRIPGAGEIRFDPATSIHFDYEEELPRKIRSDLAPLREYLAALRSLSAAASLRSCRFLLKNGSSTVTARLTKSERG
mgnify:CR=1 FL=1